jgi:hypothetical protein
MAEADNTRNPDPASNCPLPLPSEPFISKGWRHAAALPDHAGMGNELDDVGVRHRRGVVQALNRLRG